MEELDEDIAVIQTQEKFFCPLTQVDPLRFLQSLSFYFFISANHQTTLLTGHFITTVSVFGLRVCVLDENGEPGEEQEVQPPL